VFHSPRTAPSALKQTAVNKPHLRPIPNQQV